MEASTGLSGLLHDLSGRARLDSEDPKWNALFLAIEYFTEDMNFSSTAMSNHCTRLVHNCRTSNNLHMLLEQASSRLEHMLSLKHSPSNNVTRQCCGALHLTSSILSYLFSHLNPEDINAVLNLPSTWPTTTGADRTVGEDMLRHLLMSLLLAVQNSYRMEGWMYDVLYFSSNLLLTLMSTQLFVGSPTLLTTVADELKLSNPDTYNGPFSHNQPFLNYIYQLLDESEAAGSGSGNNTLQAKRFLSSLLTHITSKPTMGSSSLVTTMIGRYHGREHTVSAAAARLEAVVTALSADGDLSMSPDGEGGPAWALNEIFSTLGTFFSVPIKVLQSIIMKVQENRERGGDELTTETTAQDPAVVTCEGLLMAAGQHSGLISLPISYTPPAPEDRPNAMPKTVETTPTVFLLPTARSLSLHPFAERCGQILLLLLFNKKCTEGDIALDPSLMTSSGGDGAICSADGVTNHVRDVFCSLADERQSKDVAVLDAHKPFSESQEVFNFKSLSHHLAKHLSISETVSLLVYCLLQYNSTFLHFLIANKGDCGGILMIALLRNMYQQEEGLRTHDTNMASYLQRASGRGAAGRPVAKRRKKTEVGRFHFMSEFAMSPEPLYVTVINALILTQDKGFVRQMFTLPQSGSSGGSSGPFGGVKRRGSVKEESWRTFDNAAWYKERALGADVSLGDVAILCVLRTALLALFRQKDKYLLSNCLAILSNLGPHIANMHAYTSERVVTIIEKLGKRIIDTEGKYLRRSRPRPDSGRSTPTLAGKGPNRASPDGSCEPLTPSGIASYVDIMQSMQETLRVVLALVCRAIRPAQQISNVQLIYALIRGGDRVVSIVEDTMIVDVVNCTNLDENGLAHTCPTLDILDSKDGKSKDRRGVKKFVNKIGNILSSVVKLDRKLHTGLPHVDMKSSQLPVEYIPLLIKHGIKWMERRTRESSAERREIKIDIPKPVAAVPAVVSSDSDPSPVVAPMDEQAAQRDTDDSDEGAIHKTAQEAVNDLINWIGSESKDLYLEEETSEENGACESAGRDPALASSAEKSSIATASGDTAKAAEDGATSVVLTYEEGPSPQDFFVPYLWSVVLRSTPEIPVDLSQTSTVDVVSAGLVEALLVVEEDKREKSNSNVTQPSASGVANTRV